MRQLTAIMFADMVGYTALMQENEVLAKVNRQRFKEVLDGSVRDFNGRVLQNYGDGSLCIFGSAIDGVYCAVEIQKQLQCEPKVDLRIGLHTGDISIEEDLIYGDGVNLASRVESLAVPGSVFITEKVVDELKNQPNIITHELGYFELKNVKYPVRIFAISNPGLAVPSRNDLKGKIKPPSNRLAVLPFVNISADPENEYFSDGITEELLNTLTKVDGLQVTSRTSAFAFKGKHDDIREIGIKLNVDKILEGSVRKAGNRVRITAQLINVLDGYHIWSENYDRDLNDIFQVQDEIARMITNRLRASMAVRPKDEHFVKPPTENQEAYTFYLKGVYFRNKLAPTDVRKAIPFFEESLKLDPHFALAAANLAGCYVQLGGQGQMDPHKAFELSQRYADQALQLDDTLAEAYAMKGSIYMLHYWKWQDAYQYLVKALEINSGSSIASLMMSIYYQIHGEIQEAIKVLEKAIVYDPLSPLLNSALAEKYLFAKRYEEAIRLTEKLLELDPHMRNALEVKGYCLSMKGAWDLAIPLFEEVHRLANHPLKGLAPLAYAYAKTDQIEKLQPIIYKMEQRLLEEPESVAEVDLVSVYWTLGDKDKAFDYLFQALNKGMAITYGLYSPVLEGMEKDPRTTEIKKRMNLL